MKKQIQIIALIVLAAVMIAGVRQSDKGLPEKRENVYMAACSESIHGMKVKDMDILEEIPYSSQNEDDEDTFDIMLAWFQDWYKEMDYWNSVRYQMSIPCHFFINVYPANDPLNCYEYRNIDESDEILWDEDGRTNTEPGYIADVVIDTYIREYGGEDTQYHITDVGILGNAWQEPQMWPGCFMKICNKDVTLNVFWDGVLYGTAVSVYIEDRDGAEVQYKRIIEYAYHMKEEKFYDYFRKHWKDAYCMFIDPEPGQKDYYYRNVEPTDAVSEEGELVCDAFGYAVADRVIDKYIRDWDGSDILYGVKLINKIKDRDTGVYHYILSVMDKDEEVLQVEYVEKQWFVMVKICSQ